MNEKIKKFKSRFKNDKTISFFEENNFICACKPSYNGGYNTLGIFSKKTEKEYISDSFVIINENGKDVNYCIIDGKPCQVL